MLAAALTSSNCPALVLNADHRPLSYYPLSLWSWQDAIKAVFLERVNILEEYDRIVRSARFEMKLPSVVSLKTYIRPARHPAFTRFNVFLRDEFECQYCGDPRDLTFDHVVPRSQGRAHYLGECRHRLQPVQSAQGRAAAGPCQDASPQPATSTDRDRAARAWAQMSAELSAR